MSFYKNFKEFWRITNAPGILLEFGVFGSNTPMAYWRLLTLNADIVYINNDLHRINHLYDNIILRKNRCL